MRKIKIVTNRPTMEFKCSKCKGCRENEEDQEEKLHSDVATVTDFFMSRR